MSFRRALSTAIVLLCATPLFAQATRTWVSGVGDDANPCSRTAPCKTFAGAISKTAAGGEIDALDPGGFGAVTITKSITIDGGPNAGGILSAGTNGVNVNGSGIKVRLRNINIHGAGTGVDGVKVFNAAEVHLDNVTVTGTTNRAVNVALNVVTSVEVSIINSTMANNTGNGVVVIPTVAGATAKVFIDNVRSLHNNASGFFFSNGTTGFVRNAVSSGNSEGIVVDESAGTTEIVVIDSVLSNNTTGLSVTGGGFCRIQGSTIWENTTGASVGISATLQSLGNNHISSNGSGNGPFPAIPGSPQ